LGIRDFLQFAKEGGREFWHEAINDAAADEAGAHMSKFICDYLVEFR